MNDANSLDLRQQIAAIKMTNSYYISQQLTIKGDVNTNVAIFLNTSVDLHTCSSRFAGLRGGVQQANAIRAHGRLSRT